MAEYLGFTRFYQEVQLIMMMKLLIIPLLLQLIVKTKTIPVMINRNDNGSWKKYPYLFNKHKNINFVCFCDRKYLSFPALYLHCQRKHQKKINTNLFKDVCKEAYTTKHTKVSYVLNQEGQLKYLELPKYSQTKTKIEQIIKEYLNSQQNLDQNLLEYQYKTLWKNRIMQKFQQFLMVHIQQNQCEDIEKYINQIPFLLNPFIQKLNSSNFWQYATFCVVLEHFSKWLHHQNYTEYLVITDKQ